MRKEDLKNWTRDMLKDRIIELGGIVEQWKRDNEKMLQITEITKKENDELKAENTALKQHIKDIKDAYDGSCFANETYDRDEKIAKMQDRIDSDCVRINRLKITIETLVDMYGLLRNQVGMD